MQHLLQQEAVCHMKRLSGRMWASFILIGFVGQLAWTIENMYFNVFLYNTISTDPNAIATMVAASAAAATITTLLMGALSDRVGRRKPFICAGYFHCGIWVHPCGKRSGVGRRSESCKRGRAACCCDGLRDDVLWLHSK